MNITFRLYILLFLFSAAGVFAFADEPGEQAVLKRYQQREERASEYYEKGMELTNAGKLDEARDYFEKAIRIVKDPEMARYIDESQRQLKKQEAFKEKVEASYKEAVDLYKQKKYHLAKDAFERVNEITPDYRSTISYLKIIDQNVIMANAPAPQQQRAIEIEHQQKEDEAALIKEKAMWLAQIEEKEREHKELINKQAEVEQIKQKVQRRQELEARERQQMIDFQERAGVLYKSAIDLFHKRNMDEALEKFNDIEKLLPDFKSTRIYIARIEQWKIDQQRLQIEAQEELQARAKVQAEVEAEKIKAQAERLAQEEKHKKELLRQEEERQARAKAQAEAKVEKAKAQAERLAQEKRHKEEILRQEEERQAKVKAEAEAKVEKAKAQAERLAQEEKHKEEVLRQQAQERKEENKQLERQERQRQAKVKAEAEAEAEAEVKVEQAKAQAERSAQEEKHKEEVLRQQAQERKEENKQLERQERQRQAKVKAEAEAEAEAEVKVEQAKAQAERSAQEEKHKEEVLRQQAQERQLQAPLEARREATRKQLEDGLEAMYQEALSLYKRGDYTAAADKFKDVQDIIPGYKRSEQYINESRQKSLTVNLQAVNAHPDASSVSASPSASRHNDVSKTLDLFDFRG